MYDHCFSHTIFRYPHVTANFTNCWLLTVSVGIRLESKLLYSSIINTSKSLLILMSKGWSRLLRPLKITANGFLIFNSFLVLCGKFAFEALLKVTSRGWNWLLRQSEKYANWCFVSFTNFLLSCVKCALSWCCTNV